MATSLADKLPRVYVFWDNSSIFISAKDVAVRKDGVLDSKHVRIEFEKLFDLARAGRKVAKAVAGGSVPPEMEVVWKRLKATGVTVELQERGAGSGKEQAVDECLQLHMLRALADEPHPQVAIVMTGDGAGYGSGTGFYADLERMYKRGWGIEVLSWDIACNGKLRDWTKKVGVYIPLEKYYESVTFIEGGRVAKTLTMKHRPMAIPNPARVIAP